MPRLTALTPLYLPGYLGASPCFYILESQLPRLSSGKEARLCLLHPLLPRVSTVAEDLGWLRGGDIPTVATVTQGRPEHLQKHLAVCLHTIAYALPP